MTLAKLEADNDGMLDTLVPSRHPCITSHNGFNSSHACGLYAMALCLLCPYVHYGPMSTVALSSLWWWCLISTV